MEGQDKQLSVGDVVIYVDAVGKGHLALVTAVWLDIESYMPNTRQPGCNVVFVSDQQDQQDPYGRQIARETSVVHRSNQPAPGRFWCRENEFRAAKAADALL